MEGDPTSTGDAREPCDLLVCGGLVMTLDDAGTTFADGAVAITGTWITALGPSPVLEAAYRPRRRISAKGFLVMPGFVNVHNHSPLMITRGMVEDLGFAPMYTPDLPQGTKLSAEDTYLFAALGAYEMMRSGSTTIMDFYRHPCSLARAHAALGTRAVIAGRVHDADPDALAQGRYVHADRVGEETLAQNAELIARWNGHDGGRIRCDWAPHAVDTCSDALLARIARLADAHGGNIHTHLAQSAKEAEVVHERTGKGPARALLDAGLLNARTIAAHCIHLDPGEIALAGQAGITVAHSPIGNAKSGMVAPILALEAAGARITLCTDTMAGDMVEVLRWAVAMQRVREDGRFVLDAATALRWATRAGADALGLGAEVGALTPGRKADLILVDRFSPSMAPIVDGAGILAYSASGHDVDTVIVDGRVVLEKGLPTLIDGPALVREAQAAAERLWRSVGRRTITIG